MREFDAQEAILQERRKRGAMMYEDAQQLPQGRMVGRAYIAPNALEYLASGLRGLGGLRQQDLATQELKDLQTQRTEASNKALADFLRQSQGAPAQATGQMFQTGANEMGDESATVPQWQAAQAPNLRGAYASLLQSPDTGMRQVGQQGIVSMAQSEEKARQENAVRERNALILSMSTPQQAIARGVPADVVEKYYQARNFGRDKVKYQDVGGAFVPVTEYGDTPQGVKQIPKTGDPFKDLLVTGPEGTPVPNQPLIGAKTQIGLATRPVNQNTVINSGPKAFETELGKLDAKQLEEWRTKSDNARASLSTVQRLRDAESQGAYSGGFAEQKLAAANLINGITGATPKGLVGSQIYNAEASKLVLEHIKSLGANPSNADREFIEKTVPRLATSKEARQAMVNFIESAASRTIGSYEDMDMYARTNRGLGGYKMPNPNAAPSNPSGSDMPSGFRVVR